MTKKKTTIQKIGAKFMSLIDGKKTTIATILGAILTFVFARGYIMADTAQLISIILVALGLAANTANAISDTK